MTNPDQEPMKIAGFVSPQTPRKPKETKPTNCAKCGKPVHPAIDPADYVPFEEGKVWCDDCALELRFMVRGEKLDELEKVLYEPTHQHVLKIAQFRQRRGDELQNLPWRRTDQFDQLIVEARLAPAWLVKEIEYSDRFQTAATYPLPGFPGDFIFSYIGPAENSTQFILATRVRTRPMDQPWAL